MRIFLALALFISGFFGMTDAANAQTRYTGYYYGAATPQTLAGHIRTSLARDPTGRTMLDARKCARDGSCAAPLNYVESFQAHDPQGGWTLANLADKLERLVIRCGFTGVYQMDRIAVTRGSSFGRSDINGMSRRFDRATENNCAWVNPDTNRPVIAPDCTNPVGVRIDLDCVYHDIEVRNPAEYSLVWARYDRETDECFAYRRVDQLFQADSPGAVWLTMPRGCIGQPCDLRGPNAILGREQMVQGQIPVTPGRYQVRVARNAFLIYCLKYHAGNGVGSSFSVGVRWQQDYRSITQRGGRVEEHARVFYESDDMLADGRRLNGPGGLSLYASNPEMERRMQNGDGR